MENFEEVSFDAGDVLFDTDKPLDEAYFLLEGSVDLHLNLRGRHQVMRIGPNQFIGDAAAAVQQKVNIDDLRYSAKAIAVEPIKAIIIPVDVIREELQKCTPLLKAWFASFVSRVLFLIDDLSMSLEEKEEQ